MGLIEKLLIAMGIELKPEQLEVLVQAVEKNEAKEAKKEKVEKVEKVEKSEKVDDSLKDVKTSELELKLKAMEQKFADQEKRAKIERLAKDSRDIDMVFELVKDSEDVEKSLTELRTAKGFLFTEMPNITGAGTEEQRVASDFEKAFDKKFLGK